MTAMLASRIRSGARRTCRILALGLVLAWPGQLLAATPMLIGLPDVDGDNVTEVGSLVWDTGLGRHVLRVTDPADGSTASSAVLSNSLTPVAIGVASGPGVHYLGTLSVDGSGQPRVDVRNTDDLAVLVRTINFLSSDWTPLGLAGADVNQDGTGDFAVLARNGSTGEIIVQVRAVTGAFIKNSFFFNPSWTPLDLLALPDFDGLAGPEFGVLATGPGGQIAVMIKNAATNTFFRNVFFLNSNWQPVDLDWLPDFSGGGAPELALLAAEKNSGQLVVMVKDAATNAFLGNVFPLGSNWQPTALAVLPDENGNGAGEVAVLGANLVSGKLVAQVRDAGSGVFLRNLFPLGSNWSPTALVRVADAGAGGGIAIGAFRTSDAIPAMQVLDEQSGAELSSTVLLGSVPPNASPVADAGADVSIDAGQTVFLDGTGSSDPDGDLLAYSWSLQRPPGSVAILSDPSSPTPEFTPDVVGQYVVTLVVDDGLAASAPDAAVVTALQPPIQVSGRITFDSVPHLGNGGLDYPGTQPAPARGVTVELVQNGGGVLQSTTTDADGDYSFSLLPADQVYVRVKARMFRTGAPGWNFTVVDNTAGNALYAMSGSVFDTGTSGAVVDLHAPSGWNQGSQAYTGARTAAPFAILDAVYEAVELVLEADATVSMPSLVINWSPLNTVSATFDPAAGLIDTTAYIFDPSVVVGYQQMFVLGDQDLDTDEYDPHVLTHEFAHYLEDRLARTDTIGGGHSITARLDPRLAFSEGFANAFSAMALGDPVYKDSNGSAQSTGFTFNVESNSVTNKGWYNESSVHSVLYDIFDTAADGVDATAAGFWPIYTGMISWHADSDALTSIFSLIPGLKSLLPANAANIDALLAGQSIVGSTMDIWGSTETNNANNNQDVLPIYSDLTVGPGNSVEVCGIRQFGDYNRLSNRRFVKFNTGTAGNYRVRVAGAANADPDLAVYRQGLLATSESFTSGLEQLTVPLAATATHVIEVYDACQVFGSDVNPDVCPNSTPVKTCLTVSVEKL